MTDKVKYHKRWHKELQGEDVITTIIFAALNSIIGGVTVDNVAIPIDTVEYNKLMGFLPLTHETPEGHASEALVAPFGAAGLA